MIHRQLIRTLLNKTLPLASPLTLSRPLVAKVARPQPLLTLRVDFGFAKVSKKEQMSKQKKKDKQKMKEEVGGNIQEIDLNKFEQKYDEVVSSFKQQLSGIRIGRLEPSSLSIIEIKVGSQNFPLSSLAQVNAKGANMCAVSPFDSSQLDLIEKSLRNSNDSLDIKRQDYTLLLTQVAQGKEVRDKLIQKVKKLGSDRKQQLKKLRSNTQEELRRFKKLIPVDRLKVIEDEAKGLFDKRNQDLQKMEKDKEKDLMK